MRTWRSSAAGSMVACGEAMGRTAGWTTQEASPLAREPSKSKKKEIRLIDCMQLTLQKMGFVRLNVRSPRVVAPPESVPGCYRGHAFNLRKGENRRSSW